jgi:hypothetical protein
MKTFKLIGIFAIVTAILFSSCSVEKRRYRKGFNVDKSKKNDKATVKDNSVPNPTVTDVVSTPPATAILTKSEPVKTTPPAKKAEPAPAKTDNKALNTNYEFKVVVGPRPDKKGKKKYPMNMR